jgi:hypothetical protein
MRICTSVAAATLATACAAHGSGKAGAGVAIPDGSTDPAAPPISGALGVSVGDGPPGTVVTLNAIRCPPRGSKPDEIFWRDSAHPDNKGGLLLTHIERTGDALQATFVVPSGAPMGLGTFETYCGVKAQGAMAGFNVDPP